jgi:hypothetical protein
MRSFHRLAFPQTGLMHLDKEIRAEGGQTLSHLETACCSLI